MFISGPARGIGRETARQLSALGANVALAGLEPERLKDLAGAIGPRAAWFEADVREREQLDKAVAGTLERFGAIDVVVANAGIAPVATVERFDPDDFERTVDVNLLGAVRTIRAALPHVVERHGYVLCVASVAAVIHLPMMSAYAAAKAGLSAFADVLRVELRGSGTAVGTAYFSFIDTDMTRDALTEAQTMPELHERMTRFLPPAIPVSRAGQAIVRGIERRSRWTVLPRYARMALWTPALTQRVAEAVVRVMRAVDVPPAEAP